MKPRTTLLLSLMVGSVYLLHQDCWNWNQVEPLVFGYLPVGLAYHGAYSLLAAGMMGLLVQFAWPKELDALEAGRDDGRETRS